MNTQGVSSTTILEYSGGEEVYTQSYSIPIFIVKMIVVKNLYLTLDQAFYFYIKVYCTYMYIEMI